MKRTCSKRSDLNVNINKLKDWFKERGYPKEIVNKKKTSVEDLLSASINKPKKKTQGNSRKGIPLVVTYNPYLCQLGQLIRRYLSFFYQDDEVKQTFRNL